jgi:hypothetical protein
MRGRKNDRVTQSRSYDLAANSHVFMFKELPRPPYVLGFVVKQCEPTSPFMKSSLVVD